MTPLLFDAAARRAGRPGIRESLLGAVRRRAPDELIASVSDLTFLDALLQPVPFASAVTGGLAIVPLFSEDELRSLAPLQEGPVVSEGQGRWWDFWQLEDQTYALSPGDDAAELTVQIPLVIVSGALIQVRRFDPGFVFSRGTAVPARAPCVPTEECVWEPYGNEPGAPYSGRCADYGCASGCDPLVAVNPDDGLWRLEGCDCPT